MAVDNKSLACLNTLADRYLTQLQHAKTTKAKRYSESASCLILGGLPSPSTAHISHIIFLLLLSLLHYQSCLTLYFLHTLHSAAAMHSKMRLAFVSILQSQEMTDLYVLQPGELASALLSQYIENLSIEEEKPESQICEDESKNSVSRLQIEIKKYNLELTPITGQFFLLIFKASLMGKMGNELGSLMMTNYRVIFFRGPQKRVDLPFGLIAGIKFNDKEYEVTFELKYPHFWKFKIQSNLQKFQLFKNFGLIYFKPNEIRNNFSFEFRLKSQTNSTHEEFHLNSEYLRFKSKDPQFSHRYQQIKNANFCNISTYSEIIYAPSSAPNLETVSRHRKLGRVPILAYQYNGCGNNTSLPIWISSSYQDLKSINKGLQTAYLKALAKESPVQVYICEGRSNKSVEESSFSVLFSANYLDLESNEELNKSESALIGVFLHKKVPIIKEILSSKWYHYIARCLDSCLMIRNAVLGQRAVLIRCEQGRDKSLLLASLVQIILDPYYRTVQGLESLVMKMFVHFGHPFSSRLGERYQCRQKCPIFLQFLDCLTQLLNQNQTSFEYNVKYLSSLANLMQINIYGTFIADSPKEYVQNKVENQTFPIWMALRTVLTINSSYVKNSGVLNFSSSLSNLTLWKQYFGSLISKKRDSYQLNDQAQDNQDYLRLKSNTIKAENEQFLKKLKQYKHLLEQLQQK